MSAVTTTPVLPDATGVTELEDWGPLDEATGPEMLTRGLTIWKDGGESTVISAGDVAIFPRGWAGTWEIHEPVRKVYAIF